MEDQLSPKCSLNDVLGDRFLLTYNFFYARTREAIDRASCQFICETDRLVTNYASLPLLFLDSIVASRQIPYLPTARAWRSVSERCPDLECSEELLLSLTTRNVLFHESLHCVGNMMTDHLALNETVSDTSVAAVVRAVLVEGFATALERLSFADATTPLHRLFLLANSYVVLSQEDCELLKDMVSHFGMTSLLSVATVLMCDLTRRSIDPDDQGLDLMFAMLANRNYIDCAERRFLSLGLRRLFGLSKGFRTDTTRLYFRSLGLESRYETASLGALGQEPFSWALMRKWASAVTENFTR